VVNSSQGPSDEPAPEDLDSPAPEEAAAVATMGTRNRSLELRGAAWLAASPPAPHHILPTWGPDLYA